MYERRLALLAYSIEFERIQKVEFRKISYDKLDEIRKLRTEPAHKIYTNDFDYGYCPLTKYATNSNMESSKTLPKKSHGYGSAGYVVKTTMKYLKQMGWESDYEKYKTTEEMWNKGYKNCSSGLFD